MVLNYIWISFFLIGFIIAIVKAIFFGNTEIFAIIMNGTFADAKNGFEISLGLTAVLTLWLGIMKIGEKAGIVSAMAKIISPFFRQIFPDIPKNHPVYGTMMLNIAANMLGLDNAATPMGLKAMEQMQELNPQKKQASNAQIMFLVLNTSGLTLIPVSIMVYRVQLGAANPTDIFIPILLATFFSTLVGFLTVAIIQKISLFNKVILSYLGAMIIAVGGLLLYFKSLSKEDLDLVSQVAGNAIIFSVIVAFITVGFIRRINVFDAFIEGGKEGFGVAIKIIPYLIAILVGIGVFRNVGGIDVILSGLEWCFSALRINTDFVAALPTGILKSLSGTGARGMMLETMNQYGADSFAGRLSCVMQGATDTTFYIIAVYFGSVGIKKTRHAIGCGLIADVAGIIAAIIISYIWFY